MKTLRILALVLILCIGLSVAAQDEPQLELIRLQDGDPVRNVFEESVDAHLYAFEGNAGDVVTITMVQEANSPLDPYLALLGAAGEVYITNDDDGDIPLAALIDSFELPSDGTYFVLATDNLFIRKSRAEVTEGETEPLVYELTLSGITTTAEEDETIEVFSGSMDMGDAATIAITPDEPIFYLTFTADEGEVVTISTRDDEDGESVDTLLYLFDPEGNRVAVNDDNGVDFFSAIEEFEIPQDGLYLIFATAWDYSQAYVGDWTSFGSFIISLEG